MSTTAPLRGPGDILPATARRYRDKTALITAERTLTYAELDDLTARAAAGLRAAGVQPGQVVSLYGPNSWQWVVAYHAILRAGAVVNPVNVMLTPPEVAFVLKDCGAAAVFAAGEQLAALRAAGVGTAGFVLDGDGPDGLTALLAAEPLEDQPDIDPDALCT